MNFLKKLGIATLGILFLVPVAAHAVPSSVDRITDHIEPLIKTDFIKAGYFVSTTTVPNIFPNASTTNVSARTAAFGGTATSTFGADGALDLKTGFTFGGDTFDELVGDGLDIASGDLIFDCSDVAGTGITCSGEDITASLGTSIDLASAEVTGVLPYANGGTGTTTGQAGRVPYFGATSYQSIATSTPAIGSVLSYSGTLGNMLGGTSGTFGINNGVLTVGMLASADFGNFTCNGSACTIDNGSVTNAMLANSTISGKALGTSLDALTATNGSLTFSGSYDGSTARTVGLNLANANVWTALQSFANSTTTLADIFSLRVGRTATTTIGVDGSITMPSGSTFTKTGVSDGCASWTSGVLGTTGVACGAGGGGGTDVNWTFFNGSGLRPATSTNQVVINNTSTSSAAYPLAKFIVFGGASMDAASSTSLFANVLSANIARFGQSATSSFGTDGSLTLSNNLVFAGDTIDELVGDGLDIASGDLIFDCSDVASTGITCVGEDITASLGTSVDLASAEVTGVLPYANGGTGTTTGQAGRVPYFGATSYQSIATSTPTIGSVLSYSGTLGNMLGGTSGTFGINNGVLTVGMLASADFGDFTCNGSACTTDNGSIGVADLASTDFGDWTCNGSACTIDANSVALTTDTTGNYVEGVTSSGSITVGGSGAEDADVTVNLNMANANPWTALQSFAISTTSLADIFSLRVGRTATTTIGTDGSVTIPSGSNLTITGKSDGCATFASGVLNSTGSACGSGGGGGVWPFTPSSYAGQAVQATSTGLWLTGSPYALIASSTLLTGTTTVQGQVNIFGAAGNPFALAVYGDTYPVFKSVRNVSTTNTVHTALSLVASTSADMANDFGVDFDFIIQDSANVANPIALLRARRDGADNSGRLAFVTYSAGVGTEKMVITPAGRVGISSTTPTSLLGVAGTTTAYTLNIDDINHTGTSTQYIYSNTASRGGEIILEDFDGAGCTSITTLDGVIYGKVATCPAAPVSN